MSKLPFRIRVSLFARALNRASCKENTYAAVGEALDERKSHRMVDAAKKNHRRKTGEGEGKNCITSDALL